jgi:shikimate dehydrogenase
MRISGSTRVYALLGDPVAHTMSPSMHNAAFTALGLDAVYVAIRCSAPELAGIMRTLALNGGGGNITVPHKQAAARVLADAGVHAPAGVNTFWGVNGTLQGAETDSAGIRTALHRLGVTDGKWCVVGTGGSALATLRAASVMGAHVAVRSRTAEAAQRFMARARAAGIPAAVPEECTPVINCTPLGLHDTDPLPVPLEEMPPGLFALDLVYRPGGTKWVQALRARGIRASDGREVLLGQGIAAFEQWFPQHRAPVEVMRAALRRALD